MLLSVLLLSLIFLLIVNWSGPKRDKLAPSHAKKLANGPERFAHSPPDIIVPILGTAKFSSRIFLITRNREIIRKKMRPIYNAPKTDEKKKKATSSFLPLHMQHCLKLDIKILKHVLKPFEMIL